MKITKFLSFAIVSGVFFQGAAWADPDCTMSVYTTDARAVPLFDNKGNQLPPISLTVKKDKIGENQVSTLSSQFGHFRFKAESYIPEESIHMTIGYSGPGPGQEGGQIFVGIAPLSRKTKSTLAVPLPGNYLGEISCIQM